MIIIDNIIGYVGEYLASDLPDGRHRHHIIIFAVIDDNRYINPLLRV
jgi:hypothetical protein